MTRLIQAVLLVSGMFCAYEGYADRIPLTMYLEKHYRDLKAAKPDWSEEQIQAVLAYGPLTKAELIKDIPASALRERDGKLELIGHVKQIIPGLHQGNTTDRTQHDKLVIETGLEANGKVVVVSALNALGVISHIDSAEDFEWLLSNRHTLAGVAPGSDAHRQIIYSMVDSDGWLGLVEQPVTSASDEVTEGTFTRYLLQGRPLQEQWHESWTWSRARQFPLGPDERMTEYDYGPDIVGKFDDYFPQYLHAAARARKFPGYPEGFDQAVLDSLDMICGLRFADPVLVDGAAAQVAWRARAAGHGCFANVTWGLQGKQERIANYDDPDRPITDDEITAVALDLVQGSQFLREVVLRAPSQVMPELRLDIAPIEPMTIPGFGPPPAPAEAPPPWGDMEPIYSYEIKPDHDSELIKRALVELMSAPSRPEELKEQAREILRDWIQFDETGMDDNARYWRNMLYEAARGSTAVAGSSQQKDVLKLLCEEGWLLPVDMEERISRAESIAWDYAMDRPDRARAFLTFLAVIQQTAPANGEHGQQLANLVAEEFPGGAAPTEKYARMWAIWDQVSAQAHSCDTLVHLDLL